MKFDFRQKKNIYAETCLHIFLSFFLPFWDVSQNLDVHLIWEHNLGHFFYAAKYAFDAFCDSAVTNMKMYWLNLREGGKERYCVEFLNYNCSLVYDKRWLLASSHASINFLCFKLMLRHIPKLLFFQKTKLSTTKAMLSCMTLNYQPPSIKWFFLMTR